MNQLLCPNFAHIRTFHYKELYITDCNSPYETQQHNLIYLYLNLLKQVIVKIYSIDVRMFNRLNLNHSLHFYRSLVRTSIYNFRRALGIFKLFYGSFKLTQELSAKRMIYLNPVYRAESKSLCYLLITLATTTKRRLLKTKTIFPRTRQSVRRTNALHGYLG